ncbi:hypothetical protein [Pseudonocardia endophytica]|uniref:Uncharacterized protein n=1 Tax=Pseudonocardia endophytica TaxID=401976 RepID=A0A4R1HRI7_PSEEN|nr:hypothetical protein [Pseudonocardia endophytica]TCK25224.1 hypothetical protein EV378_1024 [Pseudonocardia endophytica]
MSDDRRPPYEPADGHGDEEATNDASNVWQPSEEAMNSLARGLDAHVERIRRIMQPLAGRIAELPVVKRQTDAISAVVARNQQLIKIQTEAAQAVAEHLQQIDFVWLEGLREQLAGVLSRIDFGKIADAIHRGLPPNWQELNDMVRISELFDITEAGYPTAWVPRASILNQLIQAETDDERGQIFAGHQAEIIEDCRTVIADVVDEDLVELAEMLEEMLTVAEGGHLVAAQALAASIFDTTLRFTIEPERISGYYAKVKAEIEDHKENASLSELRWGLVHIPAVAALKMFNAPAGDPVPDRFNRHASAHAVGRVQYSPANALIAVTLATSLVREAQEQISEETEDDAA